VPPVSFVVVCVDEPAVPVVALLQVVIVVPVLSEDTEVEPVETVPVA